METNDPVFWHALAQQLRVDSIRSTTAAGSGHPTSSMSAADLMAVLICKYYRYDFDDPSNPNNDYLIFSKGHASPLLYSIYKAVGVVSDDELMTLRKFGSRLAGHPTPILPWVAVATGSLGQGIPISVGLELTSKYLNPAPFRMWVLLGDNEMAEGSNWEAISMASHHGLSNIVGILDMNRLGQVGETLLGWNGDAYAQRARAFGWHAIEIDGHDLDQIDNAYAEAERTSDKPTLIIARTIKAKGFSEIENKVGWHGKALPPEMAKRAIEEMGGIQHLLAKVHKPEPAPARHNQKGVKTSPQPLSLPKYQVGTSVATRVAYGDALTALADIHANIVAIDGDMANSTFAETFEKAFPERFFQMYISEQLMVGVCVGMQARGYIPFASTFAAFFTRAYDFVRMAAISRANIRLCGSHAGVSIGQDGPSQMALEDLAMMRAVHGSLILYPSDANQAAKLLPFLVDHRGIGYFRTARVPTPVIYTGDETFRVGGSWVLRESDNDLATIVAAGVTVHEALKAYDQLQSEGIPVRVIDAYSVKPIDSDTLQKAASETHGRVIVVEDHWIEGGLGDAVLSAFSGTLESSTSAQLPRVTKLGVHDMPSSGTPEELLEAAGISASSIVEAIREQLS